MTTFTITGCKLCCTYPFELKPGRYRKVYSITSCFNAYNVYRTIFDEYASQGLILSTPEELLLWRSLLDLCKVNKLYLFRDEDLPSIYYYLPGSNKQYTRALKNRITMFLGAIEGAIVRAFNKENSIIKKNTQNSIPTQQQSGGPAPYTEKRTFTLVPRESH